MRDHVFSLAAGRVLPQRSAGTVVARNVPYAAAGRFEAPLPHARWDGVRDGRIRGPVSPQLPSRLDGVTGAVVDGLVQSEDCQVLSVAAPADAQPGELPVLVWFHGGAYLTGGGEAPKYDPATLAARGRMVVVSVTHRLGVLGYLPPSHTGVHNLGLLDQIEALRWVQREIAAFGGDVGRVTIAGQSAGADSVYCLMAASSTNDLFHRAILSSAPLGLRSDRQPMIDALQAIVDEELGDGGGRSIEQVLAVQARAVERAGAFGALGGLPFAPIMGIDPLPTDGDLHDALAAIAPQVEVLVGHTRHEAAAFLGPGVERPLDDPALADLVEAITETVFAEPARALATLWGEHGGRAASFVFDGAPSSAPLGACHCADLPYVFGTDWSDAPMLGGTTPDPHTVQTVQDTWARFAHDGVGALPDIPITLT